MARAGRGAGAAHGGLQPGPRAAPGSRWQLHSAAARRSAARLSAPGAGCAGGQAAAAAAAAAAPGAGGRGPGGRQPPRSPDLRAPWPRRAAPKDVRPVQGDRILLVVAVRGAAGSLQSQGEGADQDHRGGLGISPGGSERRG